ncbi:MAG: hypothetical protein ACO20F_10585, partial [Robiginitalea sp.]
LKFRVMDAIKRRLKATALLLTTLMLFQSCVVYHKTPTTLEKASQEQIKTKVTNTDGDVFKYKYITYENGLFYGVDKKSGEWMKISLDQKDITGVYIENNNVSNLLTVLLVPGSLAVLYVLLLLAYY